ncbi:MAG TPA: TIM44-like domain-containing protein, partial [Pyrinomonadaceae bacterium]
GACLIFAAVSWLLLAPLEVIARVGGGHSYGGGGSSGGGSHGGGSGDGGAIAWLIFEAIRLLVYLTVEHPLIGIPLDILVILGVVYFFRHRKSTVSFSSIVTPSNVPRVGSQDATARSFARLRKFDPNFSEIVFTDFAYALYGKAHDARGHGTAALDLLSPYLSESARKTLMDRNPPGIAEVKGIIVGAMSVAQVEGLETPLVRVGLIFETNYTEVVRSPSGGSSEMTYYVTERWNLERKRDLLSPPPAQATALHCPRCGAPLQRDTVGACAYCGTKIDSGEFQWYVRSITVLGIQARGPLLTSDVPEVGTDYPTVIQPNFEAVRAAFDQNNPEFSWGEFQTRAKLIFDELQAAWSSLNWERARPHETDNIFQMHQYWIEAYRRQGMRNIVDNCTITAMQPVKIQEDAFYQAITLRIWAQGNDYTVDSNGNVVSGSRQRTRQWSEYWTFIRNRQAKSSHARTELSCPNCASPLKVNASGICEFCGGKITSGEFDWVLSKIEQDESYAG